MKFRRIIEDYFTFSRNERRGIIILMVLIVLLGVANKVIFMFEKPSKIDKQLLDSLEKNTQSYENNINDEFHDSSLFNFNPNLIDSTALDSLNIPDRIKKNLINFRKKGGRFYHKSDFRKIYGMNDSIFEIISPFIRIDNAIIETKKQKSVKYFRFNPNYATNDEFNKLGFSNIQIKAVREHLNNFGKFENKKVFFTVGEITAKHKTEIEPFLILEYEKKEQPVNVKNEFNKTEINSADVYQFKNLPQIGDILSARIVKYRDLLGGFYSIDQLREVYGINVETYELIKNRVSVDNSNLKKIDINFANEFELSKHPYLNKEIAKKIVNFRSKFGMIKNFNVLRDSLVLTTIEFEKLVPYF